MNIKKLSDRKRRYLFRLVETETDKEIIARCDATLEDALKKFSVRNSVAHCLAPTNSHSYLQLESSLDIRSKLGVMSHAMCELIQRSSSIESKDPECGVGVLQSLRLDLSICLRFVAPTDLLPFHCLIQEFQRPCAPSTAQR